jgi:zinc/manganese transport system substrate-binding protein
MGHTRAAGRCLQRPALRGITINTLNLRLEFWLRRAWHRWCLFLALRETCADPWRCPVDMRAAAVILIALGLAGVTVARAEPLRVVAAENFYGDIVEQLGGTNVKVLSVLTNPDQDPHLFAVSASTARAVATARLVIFNGANYDPWMLRLLSASPAAQREVIEVARVVQRTVGDNPHFWYDPTTIPILAGAVSAVLRRLDPDHRAEYAARLTTFKASLRPLNDKIAALRRRYSGVPVTATESIFNDMADAIGLTVRNQTFQLAVMNGVEPGAAEIAAFQQDLKTRAVKVLLYNQQTTDELTARMLTLAKRSDVPIVAVTETEPPQVHFQDWMLEQLTLLGAALAGNSP